MCEYCGCQALPAIAELTREHDLARTLVRSARAALACGEVGEARRICLELSVLLGPHTAVEEEALFPAMAQEFPDQIAALIEDHAMIDAALAEAADGNLPAEGWALRVDAALALLPGHILREQDGVFPAALTTLTPAQWDTLDQARAERRPSSRAS